MRINLKLSIFIILLTTVSGFGTIYGWDYDEDRIPNGEVFGCDTCHGASTHQLNSFGAAYNSAGRSWTQSLANADSDNDGFSNGTELLDPDGEWSTGQADPGDPSDVTNPGNSSSHPSDPTATPVISPTPQPTATPANTATATPMATATPSDCSETGVTIDMPAELFKPNDPCYCNIIICNADPDTLQGYPLVVLLDVYGQFFFAPSFTETLDFYQKNYPAGTTTVSVLPEFSWPAGAGSASGIIWYAALTDPGITSLKGTMDMKTFGWTE